MTHPHSNRNVVLTAVLTRSRLVSLNAARHVPTAVLQSTVTSPRPVHVVNKKHSPIRRPINHRPATKNSNFFKKVIAIKVNMVNAVQGVKGNAEKTSTNWGNPHQAPKDKCVIDSGCSRHMTGNIYFLLDFEEINGGYVAFGGNPKGGKITGKGIKIEFSVARTPQQNGVAERKNRTLIEAARTMLAYLLLHIFFWAEAVNTTCYVKNRVLVTKPRNKTPYELLLGRSPSIGFMRSFGCPVTILNTLDPLGKFDGKADEGFLVRYSVNSKAFRGLALNGCLILILLPRLNYQPVVAGNQPNDNAAIKENLDVGKVGKETISAQKYVMLPLWSTGSHDPHNTYADVTDAAFDVKENENDVYVSLSRSDKPKKHDDKAKRDDRGKSLVDSPTGVKDLRAEFEEFSINSTNRVNAVSAPVTAAGPTPTNSTNNFNTARTSDTVVSPIARKSLFVDPSKYLDDPNMPELEDIVYSDDEENVGTEADFSNFETNISVSHIPTTKEPKKVHQALKDPSWIEAMQEELLQFKMQKRHTQEEGIDYDEVFAQVARIEAIRLFLAYVSFMGFMVYQMDVKSAFLYETIKEEVYVSQPPKFEDSNYSDKVYKVVKALYGLHQAPRACQDKYVAKILRKFGFTDVKSASIPIETEKPLLKNHDGEDVNVHIYRYPKGKPHLGLWYPKDSPFNLVAYSDSHYAVVATSSTEAEYVAAASCRAQDKVSAVVLTLILIEEQQHISNESTLLGVNKPRCDEDSIELMELMVFMYALVVNPTIYVSCIKQFWATTTIKKLNDAVELRALIDGKKVVVTKDVIKRYLRSDDADGVECLPNEEIFTELACMGAKRTAWNKISYSMASAVICLATGRKFNFSKYIFDSMVRNVDSPSKILMYPRFLQIVINNQLDDLTSRTTRYTSPALTQKLFANMRRVGKGFSKVETPLFASMLGRIDQQDVSVATNDVNAAKPIVFDDEEVTMTMAQIFIKLKAENDKLLDEQMAQRMIYGITYNTFLTGLHSNMNHLCSTFLADKEILSGADNRPPMQEKDMYDSWKSRMELYMLNRQHGWMILESVENGPLLWLTVEENGVT
uniref:Ribonuclease H-like domain-containing protein n=1 Tax=Tanacetum cinerariifolium TaxID=118510 RepID=A0A6L2NXI0_TANCI|nr:ribonuclease H-like domain-containing protein [Tanacetum cinerariifolium]